MSKGKIKDLIVSLATQDGLTETGVPGVQVFRATQAIPCIPAVYDPCVIAIVSGSKEAVLDGNRYLYDSTQYLCCPMSMPVQAGTPNASPEDPLYGLLLTLDPRIMSQVSMEMERAGVDLPTPKGNVATPGVRLASWDAAFTDAVLRLLQLSSSRVDMAVLCEARLRELYYAILVGGAGVFARQAFGAGNAIARSIAQIYANLETPTSIDELARQAGMSRAVFHRKFKQTTSMSPVQFAKTMRLNHAAMKIVGGMSVNEAAMEVGYVSPSQFSREFKRMYGQPPRAWVAAQRPLIGLA